MKSQKQRCASSMMRSVTVMLLTAVLLCITASAWAGTVTWTSREDFENNAVTGGPATSRTNVDTATNPGAVVIADGSKDYLASPTITPVTAFNKVYAAGADGLSIAVVNPATKALIKTIPLPGRIAGAVYNTKNYKLYVGNQDANIVSIIDTSSDTDLIRSVSINGSTTTTAYVAAYNSVQDKVYVVNTADRAVAVLDGVSDSVLVTKTVTPGVTLGTYADGKVYLTNKTSGFLNIVDGVTDTVESVEIKPETHLIGGTAPGNVGLRIPNVGAMGIAPSDIITLFWDYECSAKDQSIGFQVRTAVDGDSFDASQYSGPGGDVNEWYEVKCSEPTQAKQTATAILEIPFTQAVELQVRLISDGLATPLLHEVRLQYDTPDLTVAPLIVAPNPVSGTGTLSISSAVVNNGGGAAGPGSHAKIRLIGNGTSFILADIVLPRIEARQSVSIEQMFTLPGLQLGTYTVEICADATNVVSEGNENNNCASTSLEVTYPDLVVTDLSGPSEMTMGSAVSISSSVKNQERVAAGVSNVALYLTRNGVDYPLGARAIGSLAPGQTDTAATSVTVPSMPTGDDYYYKACADSGNAVTETIEDNNCWIGNSPVSVYSVLPDLVVKSVSGSVANGKLTYTVVVKNMGSTVANRVYTSIVISPDTEIKPYGNDLSISGPPYDTIEPHKSVMLIGSGDLPVNKSGVYYVGARADRTDSITEYDETNNSLAGNQVTIVNDVVIVPGSVSGSVVNGKLQYTVAFQNLGNGMARASAAIYISRDSTITGTDDDIGLTSTAQNILVAGTPVSMTGSADLPINVGGTFYVGAYADRTSSVPESDESNNTLAGNQVIVTNDIVVVPGSFTATVENGKLNYAITLQNLGNGMARASAAIYISRDSTITGTDDDIGLTSTAQNILVAGTPVSMTGSGDVSTNLSGTFYVGAYADRTSSVPESDESNNVLVGNQVTIP